MSSIPNYCSNRTGYYTLYTSIIYEGDYILRSTYKQDDRSSRKQNKCNKIIKKHYSNDSPRSSSYLNKNAASTNENIEILLSYQETLKRKVNAIKSLEDKILELENDQATIEGIPTESRNFKSKEELNLITKFIVTNTTKKKANVQKRPKQPAETIKLAKLQIAKFGGGLTTWQ